MADLKKKKISFVSAKMPTKTTMNLCVKETTMNSLSVVIPTAVILIIAIFCVYKFLVADRLDKLADARIEVEQAQTELAAIEAQTANYMDVREEYYRYTGYYMDETELALVNRLDILRLLEECVSGIGDITNTSISENEVVISLKVGDLDDLAEIRENLQASELVTGVTVYSASAQEDNSYGSETSDYVLAKLGITVANPEEEETAE